MVKELEIYLAKLQDTKGTAEVLAAEDYVPVTSDSSLEVIPSMNDISAVSGIYDQDAQVVGTVNVNAKIVQYLFSRGADTAPYFGTFLQACGFKETITEVATGKNKYGYASDLETKDLSLAHYALASAATGIHTKGHSILLDPKFSLEPGKTPMVEFNGKGCYSAHEAVASIPAISKTRYSPPSLVSVTSSIMGVNYGVTKFEISCNVASDQRLDWSNAYGFGYGEIGKKSFKWNASIYCDYSLALPLTTLLAGTQAAVSFLWGPTGRKIKISSAASQVTNVKMGTAGSIRTFDVEGLCVGNDLAISVNDDITA